MLYKCNSFETFQKHYKMFSDTGQYFNVAETVCDIQLLDKS